MSETIERSGPWMETYSGKKFYLQTPHVDDICLGDIAHALSLICRFNGHSRVHYSVAQHSVYCSRLIEHSHMDAQRKREAAILMLLHDAPEAYLGDLTQPLKLVLSQEARVEWARLEQRIAALICLKYSPGLAINVALKRSVDEVALMTEARDFMHSQGLEWYTGVIPQPNAIEPLQHWEAEKAFLDRAAELGLPTDN